MRNVRQPWSAPLLACSLVWLVSPPAQTGEGLVPVRQSSVLAAPLVDTAPGIDGRLDDAAWQKAQPLRHFAYLTKAVMYQTEGWICRDAKNLYIAARCFDDSVDKLVTEFTGGAIWKNDCVELFIVPEKRLPFFCHIIVSCDGQCVGGTWKPDEWGEPTRGRKLKKVVKTGREKNAWTMELALPIEGFGFPITDKSVWAFGLNREKHSEPTEVSNFQGGFNRPKSYPDLRFDGRRMVVDGVGLRNLGAEAGKVSVTLSSGDRKKTFTLDLEPRKRAPIDWRKHLPGLKEEDEFTVEVFAGGGKKLKEVYRLCPAAEKPKPVDLTHVPAANFKKSVLDDPDFFPVSVWAQPAGPAEAYKKMGVNVYVGGEGSYPRPKDREFLDAIQRHGMYAIINWKQKYVEEEMYKHPAVIGWMFGDEPDNADSTTGKAKRTPESLFADFVRIRSADPGRRVYVNLGCGVADERFVGRGATDEQYTRYPKACDIVSYDVYPCNSLGENGPNRLHMVAKGVDRLRKWSGPDKLVWFWLEANRFTQKNVKNSRSPSPEEVRTMIWMVLVHGANGYGFFCHTWHGKFRCSGIEPEMREALGRYNAEVHKLARVLNSRTVDKGAVVATTRGSRVDTLVKRHGGAVYVFAVNMYRKPEKPVITVKGIGDAEAEVLFENRTVEVKGGRIVDDFSPYAVHRYKIAGE